MPEKTHSSSSAEKLAVNIRAYEDKHLLTVGKACQKSKLNKMSYHRMRTAKGSCTLDTLDTLADGFGVSSARMIR